MDLNKNGSKAKPRDLYVPPVAEPRHADDGAGERARWGAGALGRFKPPKDSVR